MTGLEDSNRGQTYTPRTRVGMAVYALLRKLLMYIVGLGRVELPTSRLSGPLVTKGLMYVRSGFTRLLTSRHFRRERNKAQKPPPARTHGVHAKVLPPPFGAPTYDAELTNPLAGIRFTKAAQFELEQAVRREVRDFSFRKRN